MYLLPGSSVGLVSESPVGGPQALQRLHVWVGMSSSPELLPLLLLSVDGAITCRLAHPGAGVSASTPPSACTPRSLGVCLNPSLPWALIFRDAISSRWSEDTRPLKIMSKHVLAYLY